MPIVGDLPADVASSDGLLAFRGERGQQITGRDLMEYVRARSKTLEIDTPNGEKTPIKLNGVTISYGNAAEGAWLAVGFSCPQVPQSQYPEAKPVETRPSKEPWIFADKIQMYWGAKK